MAAAATKPVEPVPGDASTEPVATGAQSHVAGRVGPPSFAQDADNLHGSEGVDQIAPGEVRPASTPIAGAVLDADALSAPLSWDQPGPVLEADQADAKASTSK